MNSLRLALVGVLLMAGHLDADAGHHAEPTQDDETSLHLGGYIQPGFTAVTNSEFDQNDQEGFEFANARLTGLGLREVNDWLDASFRFNFDVNQGNFSVRDVYGSLSYAKDLLALDVGQMKMPFGLALLQSEAYLQMPFSARTRQLSFGRDLGARLRGAFAINEMVVRWSGMVANGEGGFRQRRNLDGEYVYAGRVEVVPLGELGKSEADLERGPLRFAIGANIGWTPSLNNALGLGDVGAKEHRYGADARLHWRGLSLRMEAILGDRGNNGAGRGFWRHGAYLQAGYVLPWTVNEIQWEPTIRVEQLDRNRDSDGFVGTEYIIEDSEARTYEASVNTYLAANSVKLHIAYRRTDFLEGPVVDQDGRPLIGDSLFLFTQVGWL